MYVAGVGKEAGAICLTRILQLRCVDNLGDILIISKKPKFIYKNNECSPGEKLGLNLCYALPSHHMRHQYTAEGCFEGCQTHTSTVVRFVLSVQEILSRIFIVYNEMMGVLGHDSAL